VQAIRGFIQVRAATCVIPYVILGGLYCLRIIDALEGPYPPFCSLGGAGLHETLDQYKLRSLSRVLLG